MRQPGFEPESQAWQARILPVYSEAKEFTSILLTHIK